MSDWPELERRLQASARQRVRRRPLWRLRRLALVPLVAAAAVAAFVVSRPAPHAPIPPDERAAVTPTAAPSGDPVERDYGVFRHPRTSADDVPLDARRRRMLEQACADAKLAKTDFCWRVDTSRLVSEHGEERYYLLRGARPDDLCLTISIGRRSGGGSCTKADATRLARPMGAYGEPKNGKPALAYTVFPDAVRLAVYVFANGGSAIYGVENNFSLVRSDTMVTSISWTVAGRRYVQAVAPDLDRHAQAPAAGCPALDPLGADADVEAVARAAADLYDVRSDQVLNTTVRPATTGDVGKLRTWACGSELAERSRVVDLQLQGQRPGAVLVGFHRGTAFVWAQLR